MSDLTTYSLGFCFNLNRNAVVLIQKNRPDWQRGRLNGVGGKIEPNETSVAAMIREFKEETGVETKEEYWSHFATMSGTGWQKDHSGKSLATVYCFEMSRQWCFENARTQEDEQILRLRVNEICTHALIPNLPVLIPLACCLEFKRPVELIWSSTTVERVNRETRK